MAKISNLIKKQKHRNFVVEYGDTGFDVEQLRETPRGWMRRRIYCRRNYKRLPKWHGEYTRQDPTLYFVAARVWNEVSLCKLKRRLKDCGVEYRS